MSRNKNIGKYTGVVERNGSSISYTLEYTQTLSSGIYGNKNPGFTNMVSQYHAEFTRRIDNELSQFLNTRPPVFISCKSDRLISRQGDSGISFEIHPYDKDNVLIGSDPFGSLRMLSLISCQSKINTVLSTYGMIKTPM